MGYEVRSEFYRYGEDRIVKISLVTNIVFEVAILAPNKKEGK